MEVGGGTIVRNWEKDVGYQNDTLWVPNIGTITSPGRFWREKSFVLILSTSYYFGMVGG